jgi:putative SOS response-associated peptidase YedK
MCAEYLMTVSNKKIQQALGIPLADEGPTSFDRTHRVRFTARAPVIESRSSGPHLVEKIFPASPFPNSRLSGLGLDDDAINADQDIRRIYDVPLWKKTFAENPLLVPMTSFFEPVYWGKDIGTVQEFKLPGQEVFFVAGMMIKPRIPKSDQLNGFSLLTHTATPQMLNYHQRLVTILKTERAPGYLMPMTPQERFAYLIKHRYIGELAVSKDRQMARGWEKKISAQEGKLQREQIYLTALNNEKVSG